MVNTTLIHLVLDCTYTNTLLLDLKVLMLDLHLTMPFKGEGPPDIHELSPPRHQPTSMNRFHSILLHRAPSPWWGWMKKTPWEEGGGLCHYKEGLYVGALAQLQWTSFAQSHCVGHCHYGVEGRRQYHGEGWRREPSWWKRWVMG